MNTADMCAEGRELYAEYLVWAQTSDNYMWFVRYDRAKYDAYRRWQEHIKDCYECKGK